MKSIVGAVFLLLFVFSLEVMYSEGCLKQEREALVALKSRLGVYWAPNSNTDCCEWEGFECNTTTGRVTKLKLYSSIGPWQLNYSDFAIFKDLKTLDLSLSGISNCTRTHQGLNNLEVLDLSDNNFKNAIGILSCLDGLSSLKSLSLNGNWILNNDASFDIFQTVLETISSKLLHLEVLDIGGNNLTNEILPSLMGFKSLKELHLSDIGLDSDLHIQDLQTVLEKLSSKLLHLEVLDVSVNNLSNEILPSLRGFTSLKELYLSFNGLDSDLHFQGLCTSLKNLEILDISWNNFTDTDIASALSGFSSLKSLSLVWSELTMRSIHKNHGFGFAWPSSLQDLSLRGNSLSNNILSQLSGLPHLKSLDLSANNLNGSLDISGLSNLTSLKILDFSVNEIVDLVVHEGSTNLSRLEILDLDWNMINGSNLQEWLWAFPSIRNLNLRYNEFKGTILDGGFRDLRNLEYLALDYSSNLKNEFFKSIGDFPSLKVLSASGCEINGTLPIGDWSKLKNLEELDLSNNGFVGQLPSLFVNMTSLRSLTLTNNHFIGNIAPNLASFTSLEYLALKIAVHTLEKAGTHM